MNSKTPRTDAAERQSCHPYNIVKSDGWNFARVLEEEINSMSEAIEAAYGAISITISSLHRAADPRTKVRWSDNCIENQQCKAALAKLTPFLK
jgi:hypothetical protein